MSLALLKLHLAQAEKSLGRSKNNNYSDQLKNTYHANLNDLFSKIKTRFDTTPPTSDSEIFEIKQELDFIFKSLEFLDSSTLNLIPYEIVECLEYAMNDWISSGDKYIIVTSLINQIQGFSFDHSIAFDDALYHVLNLKYNIQFTHRLVQINHPKALSKDYLASVVLYHELGHFIDLKNSITQSIAQSIWLNFVNKKFSAPDLTDLLIFLPFLNDTKIPEPNRRMMLAYHIAEYFCDLFAAQYIGEGSNHYLNYITEKNVNFSFTHPSTVNRVKTVKDFLSSTKNIVIDLIQDGVFHITSKKFEIRFDVLPKKDFYSFLPCEISTVKQLHGLYSLGWEIWNADWAPFTTTMNLGSNLSGKEVYLIINNLIEKSIGNFIVTEKWKTVHP